MPPRTISLFRYLKLKRVLALNALLFAFVGWGVSGEYARGRSLEVEISRLQRAADDLQAKNTEIGALSERFLRPDMIEREARLKLGLQRPGESVIIVKESPTASVASFSTGVASAPAGERVSNMRKWWAYFLH
ncbi:MAG: septum formation initiator family protein [Patescibacteria group bacterium]